MAHQCGFCLMLREIFIRLNKESVMGWRCFAGGILLALACGLAGAVMAREQGEKEPRRDSAVVVVLDTTAAQGKAWVVPDSASRADSIKARYQAVKKHKNDMILMFREAQKILKARMLQADTLAADSLGTAMNGRKHARRPEQGGRTKPDK